MSLPSTPGRLIEDSTTSTPVQELDGAPMDQLTPESKVKAMLAALEDSDTDGEAHSSASAVGGARRRVSESFKKDGDTFTEGQRTTITQTDEEDEDEDEKAVVAPRGKLAARLHGQPTATAGNVESDKEPSANAYERIKQQLLQKPQESIRVLSENTISSNESGKKIPITRKALRRKKPKAIASDSEASSTLTPQHGKPSPGLFLTPEGPRSAHTPADGSGSPGLFITPTPTKASRPTKDQNQSDGSDADLPLEPHANHRFLLLVARKREERQARDAAEKKKKADRMAMLDVHFGASGIERTTGASEEDSEGDVVAGKKLTQHARPIRKASKKALEEMNRETQRMSRNMQLAHQAKTKKKIPKESFLARFNFGCLPTPPATDVQEASSSLVGSSAPVSDVEVIKDCETPPTSPAMPADNLSKMDAVGLKMSRECVGGKLSDKTEDGLPSVEDVMANSIARTDKGKGKATETFYSDPIEDSSIIEDVRTQHAMRSDMGKNKAMADENHGLMHKPRKVTFTQPPIKIKPPKTMTRRTSLDSESDLEILPISKHRKSRRLDVLDRLPAQKSTENHSLQTLRALAHLTSPSKQGSKSRQSVTPAEMQMSLQKRARQQAARERAEKIQDLKDRGIIIQSVEERARDQAEVEDLLEKARREADEITKNEKDAARKERRENGVESLPEDSSEEDDEFKDDEVEVSEVELSGSEGEADGHDDSDEEMGNEEDEGEITGGVELHNGSGDLVDNEASEDGSEGATLDDDEDSDREGRPSVELYIGTTGRRNKISRVIDEEDGEDSDLAQDMATSGPFENPIVPNLHGSDDAPMGLTQAFAATMADSQTQTNIIPEAVDQEQNSLAFLRGMPEPGFPTAETDAMILDSQPGQHDIDTSQLESARSDIELHLSQSQIDQVMATQCSELPDPSQDVGFRLSSPINTRFISVPPSTIDTIVLSQTPEDETTVKKKGRLRRRAEVVPEMSDNDEEDEAVMLGVQDRQFDISANAFDVLKQAHQNPPRKNETFERTKSDAKGMVEEQAEESEDEYAGLGGASDEESGGEEDDEVRKMIDEGEVKVDERKLAAFYA